MARVRFRPGWPSDPFSRVFRGTRFCPMFPYVHPSVLAHGFSLFSMARYTFFATDTWNTCFDRDPFNTCSGRASRSCPCRRLHMFFPCFPWRASSSGPDGLRTRFLPVSRGSRFLPVSPYVDTSVIRTWFCPSFSSRHNVRQLLSLLVDHVHTHFRHKTLFVCVNILRSFDVLVVRQGITRHVYCLAHNFEITCHWT